MTWACSGPDFRGDSARDEFRGDPDPVVSSGDDGQSHATTTTPDAAGSPSEDSGIVVADSGNTGGDASVTVAVDLKDCSSISCPANAPYPVGCSIKMDGTSDRACAAGTPAEARVYFKEGDVCNDQAIKGTLLCSATMGAPLDAKNCPLMHADGKLRAEPKYPTTEQGCPGN